MNSGKILVLLLLSMFLLSIVAAAADRDNGSDDKINEKTQGAVESVRNNASEEMNKNKEEQQAKTEDRMMFSQSGNNYSGKYVSFQYSNGSITDYTLGGKPVFESISVDGFNPGSINADGSEIRFADERIELELHDNPDGLIKISAEENTSVAFTLYAGIGASVIQDTARLTGITASIMKVGGERNVGFTLSGNILNATLDHAKIIFRATPAQTDKEKELEDSVDKGVSEGKIGAVVHVDRADSSDVVTLSQVNVSVGNVESKTVSIDLSSDQPGSKTVMLSINNDILGAVNPADVKVLLDGNEIQQADNYSDIMKEDKAKYLIVIGAKDVEALVSIPKFSEHQITVTTAANQITVATTADQTTAMTATQTTVPPRTPGFTLILAVLAFAAWYFVRMTYK